MSPDEVVDVSSTQKIPSPPRYAKYNKPNRLKYREKVRIEFVQSLLAASDEPITRKSCVVGSVVVPPPIDNDTSSRIIQSCMIPINGNEEDRPSKNHSHMTQGEYIRHKKQPQVIAVRRCSELVKFVVAVETKQNSNDEELFHDDLFLLFSQVTRTLARMIVYAHNGKSNQQQRPITILDVGGACGYLTIPLLTMLPKLIGRYVI
jgi:hypothetical protein